VHLENNTEKPIRFMEVGPRDGLQNEVVRLSAAQKATFIEDLVASGLARIEAGAFVHPKWIPSMAESQEVIAGLTKNSAVRYAALIPNMVGFQRALESGVHEVSIVLSVSNTHNQKNINASTEEALQRYRGVVQAARENNIPFRAYVSCAFGCPYEGKVAVDRVVHVAKQLHELGAYELSIGDTIGVGNPKQTQELVQALQQEIPIEKIAMHLHDTRGTALANMMAAYDAGVRAFDSAAGGLGGCPYAPGASGNVATEDVVYMFESMGIATGVNLDLLVNASEKVQSILGRQLPSKAFQAVLSQRQFAGCE
jgi:hydroxymethylglutaryl-CoA lyase